MEKKYYGILMERHNITNDVYSYVPKYLIEGSLYEKGVTLFQDNMGNIYFLSDDAETIFENRTETIYYTISEDELKDTYPNMSLDQAKSEYFNLVKGNLHLGFNSNDNDKINVFSFDVSELMAKMTDNQSDDALSSSDDETKSDLDSKLSSYNGDEIAAIPFSLLKEMLNMESSDQIKACLEKIYHDANEINQMLLQEEKDKLVESSVLNIDNLTGEECRKFLIECYEKISHASSIDVAKNHKDNMENGLLYVANYLSRIEPLNMVSKRMSLSEFACNYIYRSIDYIDWLFDNFALADIIPQLDNFLTNEKVNIDLIAVIYDAYHTNNKAILDNLCSDNKWYDVNSNSAQALLPYDAKELKRIFDRTIIGQEEAKRVVISTIIKDYLVEDSSERTPVLLVGPTGSGKTLIIDTLCKAINIPFEIYDSTNLTIAGYVGGNIEDALARLIGKANGDLKKAEHGIFVFDEIDKKSSTNVGEPSGIGVLNSLLSFLQGTTYDVKYKNEIFHFNTSKLTIFLTGSFRTLVEYLEKDKRYGVTNIGFSPSSLNTKKEDVVYPTLTPQDLKKKMPNEFVARVPIIVQLQGHTINSLKAILTESEGSALLANKRKLAKLNVKLEWDESYLDQVATKAYAEKEGGRSIKRIVEKSLQAVWWEIITNIGTYTSIMLTDATVEDNMNVILTTRNGSRINLKEQENIEHQKLKNLHI